MKLFKAFRLDKTNHSLWRNGDRVSIAAKAFDVLAYLVEHAWRVVTQDEILEALWPETYVNPEVLRKYILEVRKGLGDRPDNPKFIETVPKRGYRFIAPVTDEGAAELPGLALPHATEEHATEATVEYQTVPSKQETSSGRRRLWQLAIIPVLAVVVAAGLGAYFRPARNAGNAASFDQCVPRRAAFCGHEPGQRSGVFFRRTRRTAD